MPGQWEGGRTSAVIVTSNSANRVNQYYYYQSTFDYLTNYARSSLLGQLLFNPITHHTTYYPIQKSEE